MKDLNDAIIAISVEFLDGVKALESLVRKVQKFATVTRQSSVYKYFLNSRCEDLNSELWMALRVVTHLRSEEVLNEISLCEIFFAQETQGHQGQVLLLTYGYETVMTPRLTLPYLKLHQYYHLLLTASEVGQNYKHPVLGQTLSELASAFQDRTQVEFLQKPQPLEG